MIVVTTMLTNMPITFTNDSATSGLLAIYLLLKSVIRLVMVNVINKMKANTRITEKESNRFLIYLSQLFRGTAFMPQIVFSEL